MFNILYRSIRDSKFKQLDKPKKGSWINVTNVDTKDLNLIAKLTDLDFDDIKDVQDEFELPRIERHGKSVVIFLRTPNNNAELNFTKTLALIVTPEILVTVSPSDNQLINELLSNEQKQPVVTTQTTKLLSRILMKVSASFTGQIKKVNDTVSRKRKEFHKVTEKDIADLVQNEEILNQYLAALVPIRTVFETIIEGNYINLHGDDSDLYQDLLISIKQSVNICSVNLKSIRSVREAHQVIFTNELNRVIKFLTSFTIILTIPTLVASIYGMNVALPISEHPFAFFIVLVSAFAISVTTMIIFFFKGWL